MNERSSVDVKLHCLAKIISSNLLLFGKPFYLRERSTCGKRYSGMDHVKCLEYSL